MSSEQPEAGVSYPIVLGSSFLDGSNQIADYSTLRLDFVPASCDRTSQGNLHIDPQNKAATLSLPSTSTSNSTVEFQGKFDPSRDDLDCVAIFDPTTKTFRLELLTGGQATLRHMPGSKRDKDVANKKITGDILAQGKEKTTTKEGNETRVPPPPPTSTAAAAVPRKTRNATAATTGSKEKEDIADDFFHGALD